jgi:hypothetical protein
VIDEQYCTIFLPAAGIAQPPTWNCKRRNTKEAEEWNAGKSKTKQTDEGSRRNRKLTDEFQRKLKLFF